MQVEGLGQGTVSGLWIYERKRGLVFNAQMLKLDSSGCLGKLFDLSVTLSVSGIKISTINGYWRRIKMDTDSLNDSEDICIEVKGWGT